MSTANWRVGIDIGGTFTDLIAVNTQSGQSATWKILTTPDDPSHAALDGLRHLLDAIPGAAGEVSAVIHATTLITNALIERKGARTALLTTDGFVDLIEIGREVRYDLYDLFLKLPTPLVPHELRRGVRERVLHDGTVWKALEPDDVRAASAELRDAGVEAIAVCYLHSYANDAHERDTLDLLREAMPHVVVSLSSEVCREVREYERLSTTVANAYVQPLTERYLSRMWDRLRDMEAGAPLLVMLSNGGIATVADAAAAPVRLVESGPAAGALIAGYYGTQAGERRVLALDMGGTTAKLCVVEDGQPSIGFRLEVARVHRFKRGSGLPLQTPSVELIEIGAGGGSIARRDELGLLTVGPESAGAKPGPACYGFGGALPTVTDADLLLGYLSADYFLGGSMPLNSATASEAVSRLADSLRLDVNQTAWGIHDLVNENMATAAGVYVAERGQDPRAFTLVATGGAGPVHAAGVARKLGIRRVLIPPAAGVASAGGLLVAPPRVDLAHSMLMSLVEVDWAVINRLLEQLEERGRQRLPPSSLNDDVVTERFVDARYVQQGHEVTVPLPPGALTAQSTHAIAQSFEGRYLETFGRTIPGVPIELVTWRVTVRAFHGGELAMSDASSSASARGSGTRPAYFAGTGWTETPVRDRASLASGQVLDGPLIIEEAASTTVIGPGDELTVDEHGNLVLAIDSSAKREGE